MFLLEISININNIEVRLPFTFYKIRQFLHVPLLTVFAGMKDTMREMT